MAIYLRLPADGGEGVRVGLGLSSVLEAEQRG